MNRRVEIQPGEIIVIGDNFSPYDFNNWRECVNFLIDQSYGLKQSLKFIKKDTEHLEVRCPVSGEYLTVLAGPDELEKIHRQLIVQNLYRPYRR